MKVFLVKNEKDANGELAKTVEPAQFGGATPVKNLEAQRNSDSRKQKRRKVYLGELTAVEVTFEKSTISCEIVDLSSSGLGVVTEWCENGFKPERGEAVHLAYGTKGGKRFKSWGVVASSEEIQMRGQRYLRIGIAFAMNNSKGSLVSEEEREIAWISCPKDFTPIAYCEDPLFFSERVHIKILEFSSHSLRVETFNSQFSLLPNVIVSLSLFLPMLGQHEVDVRICQIEEHPENHSSIMLMEFLNVNDKIKSAISEYLLLSKAVNSIADLRKKNFEVENIDRALSFRYANTPHDFQEILGIRKSGLDKFDEYSRQIICSIGDKTIACARLVFTEGDPSRSEFEGLAHGIPHKYWIQHFVEASRFYCQDDYSPKEVYLAFLAHFVRITAESGARYLFTACSSKSLRLYDKLGFKPIKISTENSQGETKGLVIVVLDVHRVLTVSGTVEASVWKKVYENVSKHIGCQRDNQNDGQRVFWTKKTAALS